MYADEEHQLNIKRPTAKLIRITLKISGGHPSFAIITQ